MVLFGVFPVTPSHTRIPEGNPHDRADRATVPAVCPLSFGITNELRTALEALADKADTCVAEVARDCIEAGIGVVRARATDKRAAHPILETHERGLGALIGLPRSTPRSARAPAARRYSLARWGGVPK